MAFTPRQTRWNVTAHFDTSSSLQACCTEAGMFALRERRVHVTQVRPLHECLHLPSMAQVQWLSDLLLAWGLA